MTNSLPTANNMQRRNFNIQNWDYKCYLCNDESETMEHVFFNCRTSRQIWNHFVRLFGVLFVFPQTPSQNFIQQIICNANAKMNRNWKTLSCSTVWVLWYRQNLIAFQNKAFDVDDVVYTVGFHALKWLKTCEPSFPISFGQWIGNTSIVLLDV